MKKVGLIAKNGIKSSFTIISRHVQAGGEKRKHR